MHGSAVQRGSFADQDVEYRHDRPTRTAVTGAPVVDVWEQAVLDAINELLNLPQGWNSYDAPPLDPQAAVAAFQLLRNIMRPGVPIPSVVPTSRGTLQFEWHVHGVDLEIEVGSAASVVANFEDFRSGEVWEKELRSDLRVLTAAMRRLTSPA